MSDSDCPQCHGNEVVYHYWRNDDHKIVMDDWQYCRRCYPDSTGTWPVLSKRWIPISLSEYNRLRDSGYFEKQYQEW